MNRYLWFSVFLGLLLLMFVKWDDRETKSKYVCGFGASSPTDLLIINDGDEKVNIQFLLEEEGMLKRFARLKVKANSSKTICIENEGTITKGFYLDYDGRKIKVVLKQRDGNEFLLKEGMLQVSEGD